MKKEYVIKLEADEEIIKSFEIDLANRFLLGFAVNHEVEFLSWDKKESVLKLKYY